MNPELTVFLSPGHGADDSRGWVVADPGFINQKYSLVEHDIACQIIKWIREYAVMIPGITILAFDKVLYKLAPLEEMTLGYKIEEINRIDPDLAIEVHMNSTVAPIDPTIHGTEVLYHRRSKMGPKAAQTFQTNLVRVLGTRSRKIKARSVFRFLRDTTCPAIITESEFLSNDKVAERIQAGFMIRQIAFAHLQSIVELTTGW